MILSFHPCITADHQIILGHRQPDSNDESYIARSEIIILPQTCPEKLFEMCAESKASVFPDYRARFDFPGKIGQHIMFKKNNLPQPITHIWNSVSHFISVCGTQIPHQFPFLLKEDRSHESEGIHIINNMHNVDVSLRKIEKKNIFKSERAGFISQEFIPNGGNTLRVVIMENRYIPYWKRAVNPDKKLSSIKTGALVDKDWKPELQKKGIAMAQELSLKTGINLAAVDFIFPLDLADPEPLFLEINYYFGRKGLGGSINYYSLLFRAIVRWMEKNGFDSRKVKLV